MWNNYRFINIPATLLVVFLLPAVSVLATESDNCIACHTDWEEENGPSHIYSRDIHFQKGLGCADCHGGDPSLEDMDEVRDSKGYRGVPDHLDVPDFCARCHSDAGYMHEHNPSLRIDQLTLYKTSVHGQRLFKDKDPKVANCVSCHTVHEIANSRIPHSSTHPHNLPGVCGRCHSDADYMAEYGLATNQLQEYKESVHGQALLERNDLGAPACNDCHGNHGAMPPGVNSLAAVCGVCHAIEAQLFEASPHAPAFAENDFPMCGTCHSNHKILKPSDEMVGATETSLCSDCHAPDDGTIGISTADGIAETIQSLVHAHDDADVVLNEARGKGMMTTDEEFLMKEVDQAVIQTRTLIHSFNIDSVADRAAQGIAKADTIKVRSAELVDEYYFRRKGLGVASLFITFLVVMLYRKIRSLGD
jgi:predicted CXXCH cytochrome family protein